MYSSLNPFEKKYVDFVINKSDSIFDTVIKHSNEFSEKELDLKLVASDAEKGFQRVKPYYRFYFEINKLKHYGVYHFSEWAESNQRIEFKVCKCGCVGNEYHYALQERNQTIELYRGWATESSLALKAFNGLVENKNNFFYFYKTGFESYHILNCVKIAYEVSLISQSMADEWIEYQRSNYRHNRVSALLSMLKPRVIPIDFIEDDVDKTPAKNKEPKVIEVKLANGLIKNNLDNGLLAKDFLKYSEVVKSPKDFPELKGIYFVRYHKKEWMPLYIGRSVNLKSRWTQHHRKAEIEFIQSFDVPIEFRYIAETPLLKFQESLESLERKLINEFKPKLNDKKVVKILDFDNHF